MRNRPLPLLALALGALALSACYEESADVTVHEPGQYKGPVDPLMKDAAGREETLQKRFQLVQIDR